MRTRSYQYPLNIQVVKVSGWFMTFIVLIFMLLTILSDPLALIVSPSEALSVLLPLAFGVVVCLYIANLYPSIGIDEDGLLIDLLWHRLRVPWKEVIEIKPIGSLFGLSSAWIVKTRKLTFLHRLYGFPHPGFFITSAISNYTELIQEIERQVKFRG
jgi:hypothetical protein